MVVDVKRFGSLYERICSFENLVSAAYRARLGKRFRPDVARFHHSLEANLLTLRDELRERTWVPGGYRTFYIHDPKTRLISAAPYRDRVVHHALCNVVEPLFDRCFVSDSYAHRAGKGIHAALDRCTGFCRRYNWVLKCDIEKFFPSMDHAILMELVERKVKCPGTLWLMRTIVANSNPQEEVIRYFPGDNLFSPHERRRGVPIGNLPSQFLSNVYLSGFDWFVKQTLRCRAYIRFADDFLVFGNSKAWLAGLLPKMQSYLDGLRLRLHPRKCQVKPVQDGIDFLCWLVYPDHRRLRRRTGVRFQRRLRELQQMYATGMLSLDEVRASIMSWIGHLKHGDTWGLRRRLLGETGFVRMPAHAGRES